MKTLPFILSPYMEVLMAKFLGFQILLSNAATAAIVLGWVTPSQAMCWTMFQLLLGGISYSVDRAE
jgi:hypothetical protein